MILNKVLTAIVIGMLYGFFEAYLYDHHFTTTHELGRFSIYHVFMGLILTAVMVVFGLRWYLFPMILLVEDMAFFVYATNTLTPDEWICGFFGYIEVFGQVIPLVYPFLLLLTFTGKWIDAKIRT